ncbi:MAG: serine hydrolase family protein [Comamonas sp.]|nr:serine hydrolase family protein [Comamonas sp.]
MVTQAQTPTVLLLPGWQNSDPEHWQSRWQALYGYQRLEQHDWQRPLRGDWTARLHEAVMASPQPLVLVAHSLGCILLAWWAAHAPAAATAKVSAALLVAPGDVEQADLREHIPGWAPVAMQPLPFPAVLVGSHNDPYCSHTRAQSFAQAWGAQWVDAGDAGHINTASGLADWPSGHQLLQQLIKDTCHGNNP